MEFQGEAVGQRVAQKQFFRHCRLRAELKIVLTFLPLY
jgi:hypothetical protein